MSRAPLYAPGDQSPPRGGDSVLMASMDRKDATLSPSAPPGRDKSAAESARDLLRRFGLEKEDLDHLVWYPQDQITPASLPFILRQIGIEKAERASAAAGGVAPPGGAARLQEDISPAVLEPSDVTDGGRGDACVDGAAGEPQSVGGIRETCTPPTDAAGDRAQVESGAPGSSRDRAGPASGLGPLPAPPSSGHTQALPGSSPLPDPPVPLMGRESSPEQNQAPSAPAPPEQNQAPSAPDPGSQSTARGSTLAGERERHQEEERPVSQAPSVSPDVPSCPPAPSDVPRPTAPPPDQRPAAKASVSGGVAPAAAMRDAAAAAPRSFPHTCCLCRRKCLHMKDWISHQKTDVHLEGRKRLRLRYPEWDGEVPGSRSPAGEGAEASARSQPPRRDQETARGGRSVSPVPRGPQSPSSRSHSGSRRTSSRRRPSPERRRGDERPIPRRRDERRLPGRRTDERRWSQSSSEESSSASCKKVAEKLLENSAVDLLSKPSDLDALLQTLAPIVLAELAKRKSPSSSSSSSSCSPPETSSTPAASSSPPPAKKKMTQKPSEASPKAECGKPPPPTMVKLTGVHASLSRSDVLAALQRFGKAKSFLLFPPKLQAIVCFEKKEDAEKLKSLKGLEVKGIRITVAEGKVVHAGPLSPKKPPPAPRGSLKGRGRAAEAEMVPQLQACQTRPPGAEAVAPATPPTVGEVIEKHLSRETTKLFQKENLLLDRAVRCFEREEDTKTPSSLASFDLKGIKVTVSGGKKTVTKEQKKPLTRCTSSVVCEHQNTRKQICVEMAEPGGVTKVVEKRRDCPFLWVKEEPVRNKVLRVESLRSLKRRLEDPDEVINTEAHAVKSNIILIE